MSHRIQLLGTEVDCLTIEQLNEIVVRCARSGELSVIANHNLNSVRLFHSDVGMRTLYSRAKIIHIDGMPLVWLGRLLGFPVSSKHRVTYVDWIDPLLRRLSAEGLRVFHLGGKPGVGERAAAILREKYPSLVLQTAHGFFDPRRDSGENQELIQRISSFRPDVLLVGMGMPRQEHWLVENSDRLAPCAVLTAGAALDYVAGEVPTPPRWLAGLGLEWLARLIAEPRRLSHRYLVEPWSLLPWLARDLWAAARRSRGRTRPLDATQT